jgi:hypothetical protein
MRPVRRHDRAGEREGGWLLRLPRRCQGRVRQQDAGCAESQALANALVETERRVEALREELEALSRTREKVFQTPPIEWIEERLSRVQEVLERRTEQSALLLRDVLGTIRLEPRKGDVGRPYYLAKTSIDCIALLETPPGAEAPDGGSNSLRQWRRRE